VAVAVAAGFLAGIAMFGGISFVPLFAQGSLGMTATEAGSLLTPLMLSWVTMSVVGGRLLLRVGFRVISIVGFFLMTLGFALLATVGPATPTFRLYIDLMLIGAGLGLTMLTLLIAVQQAVERTQLGVVTSLNQFSRAIGGALGVAFMGAILTAGLATQLQNAARAENSVITPEQAAAYASNPNALIEPTGRASLPPQTFAVLQQAMSGAIKPVFWVGGIVSVLALFVALLLPKRNDEATQGVPSRGEKMLMAEQTTINARNQPVAQEEAGG
jgi:MFS family permease